MSIGERGHQHRGIDQIFLGRGDAILQHDFGESRLRRLAVQEAAEHRIAVEARQAIPDDAAVPVDQRGNHAVADDAEIEIGHQEALEAGVDDKVASHFRTSAGSAKVERRTGVRPLWR